MELKIKKETAKKIYADAPSSLKEILVETFGWECFQKRKYDEIKTFEDACEELELTQEDLLNIRNTDAPDETAYKKLKIVIKAINQGWTPDWSNTRERKWWPYFVLSSGFGFSDSNCFSASAGTCVGSRLCTDTREKALYIAEQFKSEYQDYLLFSK